MFVVSGKGGEVVSVSDADPADLTEIEGCVCRVMKSRSSRVPPIKALLSP